MNALRLLLTVLLLASAAHADPKPNIVILLADDLRPDCLSSLGHPMVKTPNVDKLVSNGFIFRRAYVMGSTMPAVCLPSRTMLLTGMSVFRAMQAVPPGKAPIAPDETPDTYSFPRAMRAA